jgi:hypothetical protein
VRQRIRRTLAGSCAVLAMRSIASRRGAHSRNVLSLDVEAVGLLRHGERFMASELCGRWVSGPLVVVLLLVSLVFDVQDPEFREAHNG